MFTIAAINIASLAGPAKLGRRAGLAKRGGRVVVRAGEKKSAGAIHDELKEKFTTSGETFEAHATACEPVNSPPRVEVFASAFDPCPHPRRTSHRPYVRDTLLTHVKAISLGIFGAR